MRALEHGDEAGGAAAEGTLSPRFWIALVLIAVVVGLSGGALMRLLFWIQSVAWAQRGRGLYEAVVAATDGRRVLVLLFAGALVAIGAWALAFVRGGHAGDLVEALRRGDGAMPVARTLGGALLSIVVVGLGAPVGREGALKQTGAVAGWRLAHRFGLDADQRRILTACGAGAGMAAAYDIPLGGAVFALEVLLQTTAWPIAVPALACSAIATAVSWTLLPMRAIYATPDYPLTPNLVAWAACVGPAIGLAAIGFVRLIAWADTKRALPPPLRAAVTVAIFATIGAAAIGLPEMVGNGKDVVQLAFDGGGGDPRLRSAAILIGLATARAIATALCLKTGTPGGLFTPTLTTGALLGLGAGRLWGRWFPGDAPGGYAAIGCAAMLAASTGGPVSAIVCVLELGRNIGGLIAPIVIASAGACLVMRAFRSPSVYTVRL